MVEPNNCKKVNKYKSRGAKRMKNKRKRLEERDYLLAMVVSKYFVELGTHFLVRKEVTLIDGKKEIIELDDSFNTAIAFVRNEEYRDILYAGLESGIEKVLELEEKRKEEKPKK